MQERNAYPSMRDFSILIAVVVMVYVFVPLFPQEMRSIQIELFQIRFEFPIDFGSLMSVIAAILASAGVDWLLESHPKAQQRTRFLHWVLPGLTAWAIGVPLSQITRGVGWWIVLALGILLLIGIILGEYFTVDLQDKRYSLAGIGLTAVTFSLFLIFAVAINGMGTRLYFLELAMIPFSLLAALRILSLRSDYGQSWPWAIGIALILGQLTFGLHYFPISAIQFGLIVTGLLYLLTNTSVLVKKKEPWGISWLAPLLFFCIFIVATILIRI